MFLSRNQSSIKQIVLISTEQTLGRYLSENVITEGDDVGPPKK